MKKLRICEFYKNNKHKNKNQNSTRFLKYFSKKFFRILAEKIQKS